jgi:hypothetical protein
LGTNAASPIIPNRSPNGNSAAGEGVNTKTIVGIVVGVIGTIVVGATLYFICRYTVQLARSLSRART